VSFENENRQGREDYQKYEHPPIALVQFAFKPGAPNLETASKRFASARIYCPDIRVVSRPAIIFEPLDPSDRTKYNLSQMGSDIIAYRCMNAGSRVPRVGEIVGKQGIPMVFPKSDIDGIAFQNDDDLPMIDVDVNLAFPGVPGTWRLYYHATSNNKLKHEEWEQYISRVTMNVQQTPGIVFYDNTGR